MTKRLAILALAFVLSIAQPAVSAEPVPGDSCTGAEENNFLRSGGKEIPTGHFIVCKSGAWRSIISWDAAAAVTKIGNLTCTSGQILKFNGTTWACAADEAGSGGITALTGDVTGSGSGSVAATIASNAVTTSKVANSAVTNTKLANMAANTLKANNTGAAAAPADITVAQLRTMLGATGTPSGTTFLRGDGTWIAPPSGADNLGNHTATAALDLAGNAINAAGAISSSGGLVVSATSGNQARLKHGNYGVLLRNDGTHYYHLLTNSGDADGSWNTLRPLTITLATGAVSMSNGLTVTGTVTATTFSGSGASLTNLPAASLTGTLPALSGANLTSLNANNLASGSVPAARLPAYTGDVTKAAGATTTTIAANAINSAKIADGSVTAADTAFVGTLTEGKWCTVSSGKIVCTSDAPGGGGAPAGTVCGIAVRNNSTNCSGDGGWALVTTCQGINFSGSTACPSGFTKVAVGVGQTGSGTGAKAECLRHCIKD